MENILRGTGVGSLLRNMDNLPSNEGDRDIITFHCGGEGVKNDKISIR